MSLMFNSSIFLGEYNYKDMTRKKEMLSSSNSALSSVCRDLLQVAYSRNL